MGLFKPTLYFLRCLFVNLTRAYVSVGRTHREFDCWCQASAWVASVDNSGPVSRLPINQKFIRAMRCKRAVRFGRTDKRHVTSTTIIEPRLCAYVRPLTSVCHPTPPVPSISVPLSNARVPFQALS